MNDYTLGNPPAALNRAAKDGWETPATSSPQPGDIWLLTWNLEPQGLILVTKVEDDFILGMPITLGADQASDGEAILAENVLGTPATLWFHAETGLGSFLLHRRIVAAAISPELLTQYRRAGHLDVAPEFAVGTQPTQEGAALREAVLNRFQALCFLEWPEPVPGEANLNTATIEALGITGENFARKSGIDVQLAFEMWTGERLIDANVATRLADNFGVRVDELLTVTHDRSVHILESPMFKERINVVSAETGKDERTVRNLARSSYALAARTDAIAGREEAALAEALDALRPQQRL